MTEKQRKQFNLAEVCFTYRDEFERVNTKLLKELFAAAKAGDVIIKRLIEETCCNGVDDIKIVDGKWVVSYNYGNLPDDEFDLFMDMYEFLTTEGND